MVAGKEGKEGDGMNIEEFRAVNQAENIIVTQHGRKRLEERGIALQDVIRAIDSGDIIEEYPEDYPFPSCLVLGIATEERYLHVVVSLNEGTIYLITAYFPNPGDWEDDWKTRKE